MTIYAMLADGFEEIEFITFVDILRRAQIEVKTVSIYNRNQVNGAHNITVLSDFVFDEIDTNVCDGIYLPGGMPGTVNLMNDFELGNLLKKFNDEKKYIIAICAAPMILGELNLLCGKNATCYPSFENHLIGANFVTNDVCVSGNIITSRGAGTAHKLAFDFVKIVKGEEFSDELKVTMLYR